MTILSVVVVLAFGAFRIGVRAWERGEKDIESRQRYRIVLDMIKGQIASMRTEDTRIQGKKVFLVGDDHSLSFVSNIPVNPRNIHGPVWVKYVVVETRGSERLTFHERNIIEISGEEDWRNPGEDDFHLLIPDAHRIGFEYLKSVEDEGFLEWQSQWDPEIDAAFPLAVRLTFLEEPAEQPLKILARFPHNPNR